MKSSQEKNYKQYLLMGAWLTIALKAFTHNKLGWLKYFSYNPSLEYISSMMLRLLSRSSKKFLSFLSEA